MTVLFDARWSGDHGIGRVSRVFDKALSLRHLKIYGKPSSPLEPLRLLITMLFLPKRSIVLSPGYNVPLLYFRPYIFTIHDLNHLDFPENSNYIKKLYFTILVRRACQKALCILTVSEFSRQRIIEWAKVPEARVVNIGNGVDDATFNKEAPPYAPGYKYFLCVGNRKAHKNEGRVIEAFACADVDLSVRLVFTGVPSESLVTKSRSLGIADRVIFLGKVAEKDLPGLYRGAVALLFPSLYEGFGLPVIEAMACGTPVLTANRTSLPEVAGDAAFFVEPESVSEITVGIQRLYQDQELRKVLSVKGLERAKEFHWEEVISRVKCVLDTFAFRDKAHN